MAIEVTRRSAVATITINRPDALNAFDSEHIRDLTRTINELSEDEGVRVVILTGAGDRAFIAGADVAEMRGKDPDDAKAFTEAGHSMCDAIESMPQPVIAAINGFALGGGSEIALACDIRLMSETAVIGQPEVGLGIPPGWGATQRLPRIVGLGAAKDLILSGRHVTAAEALRIGLVNRVCPPNELMDEAYKLANVFLSKGPDALATSKQLINRTMATSLETGLEEERKRFAEAFGAGEQSEGMAAFLERRKPEFDVSG